MVCVCIPTRNRVEYVTQALRSVREQTHTDFRVLVSDDASAAEASLAVERHIRSLNDPRVSYRYHTKNLGEFDHGRTLFAQCQEPMFAILHDDDVWEPSFLSRCLGALSTDESLACAMTNEYVIDEVGHRQAEGTRRFHRALARDRYPEGPVEILEPFMYFGFFQLSATVFRTAALRASAFVDAEYEGNSAFDTNVFLRLGERNEKAYYVPEALVGRRVHRSSLTSTWDVGLHLNRSVLEKLMSMFEKRAFAGDMERQRRKRLSVFYHQYAVVCYLKGDRAGMYRYLAKCVRTAPWRARNWVYATGAACLPFLLRPMFKARVVL